MKLTNRKRNLLNFRTNYNFLIPLLLLFQITLPGVVLCIEADGQIVLESSNAESCSDYVSYSNHNQDSYIESINYAEYGHCGECIDIRISESSSEKKAISSKNFNPGIDIYAFAAYVLSPFRFHDVSSQRFIIQESPPNNTFLDSLQTTVIIC